MFPRILRPRAADSGGGGREFLQRAGKAVMESPGLDKAREQVKDDARTALKTGVRAFVRTVVSYLAGGILLAVDLRRNRAESFHSIGVVDGTYCSSRVHRCRRLRRFPSNRRRRRANSPGQVGDSGCRRRVADRGDGVPSGSPADQEPRGSRKAVCYWPNNSSSRLAGRWMQPLPKDNLDPTGHRQSFRRSFGPRSASYFRCSSPLCSSSPRSDYSPRSWSEGTHETMPGAAVPNAGPTPGFRNR